MKYKVETLSCYATMGDMLKIKYLGFRTTRGKRNSFGGNTAAKVGTQRKLCALTPNKYPYHLAEGLKHYVYWSLGEGGVTDTRRRLFHPARRQRALEGVENYVSRKLGVRRSDFVVWKNPDWLMSIPGIWHAHVIVREDEIGSLTFSESKESE